MSRPLSFEKSHSPKPKKEKRSSLTFVLAAMAIGIMIVGASVAYGANILPGYVTTSTSIAGSSTTTSFQTAIATQTTTNIVTGQNTTEIQPAVLLFTTTAIVTVTTTVGTNTTTYMTGTTITNSTTTTISCTVGSPPPCPP